MSKPKVLFLAGNPYLYTKVANEGIEVISKNLPFEEVLAEINITDATHLILHDACLNGGAYCKRIEQLRRANDVLSILLISHNKKPGANIKKAYSDHRVEYLPENTSHLADKIIDFIRDTSPQAEMDEQQNQPSSTIAAIAGQEAIRHEPRQTSIPPTPEPLNTQESPIFKALETKPPAIRAEPETPTILEPEAPIEATRKPQAPHPPSKSRLLVRPPTPTIFRKKERAANAAFSVGKIQTPPATVVIPVFSGSKGAGCTWVCVQMATYLVMRSMRCAVTGGKDILFFSPKGELEHFELNGIDFHAGTGLPSLLTAGYDYVLLDVGQIMDFHADHTAIAIAQADQIIECQRAPNKYMVTDYTLGRGLALDEIMMNKTWRNLAANCTLLLTPRQPAGIVNRLEKRYKRPVHTLPECEPFTLDNSTEAFIGNILRPTLFYKEENVH